MTVSTEVPADRAILVGVYGPKVDADRRLNELASLVRAANGVVVGSLIQRRPANSKEDKPLSGATYIRSGKVQELAFERETLCANVIVFDNELSPAQIREIEKVVQARVVDRSEVILDIFARRARSKEAKLQVELAQLQYTAPRLRGMWTHLERQAGQSGGGGIATRGPGEKQLEIDRRIVQFRLKLLGDQLKAIQNRKEREVKSRSDSAWSVGLVGYTNAGKSTLLNALTSSEAWAADQLFATLDTVSRKWEVSPGVAIPLSDTVGFVRDLPHHLVTGFRSTLAEALHAALLLHVIDASHPDALEQLEVVKQVLADLEVPEHKVMPVLNKIDAITGEHTLGELRRAVPGALEISAAEGIGLKELAAAVAARRSEHWVELILDIPHDQGKLMALVNARGKVEEESWDEDGWHCRALLPDSVVHEFREVVRA